MKLKHIKDFILNLLFPKRCIWCDKVVGFASSCACEEDVEKLKFEQCALSLGEELQHTGFYRNAYAVYHYEGAVKNLIWRLKFRKDTHLATEMAKIMAGSLEPDYDFIIPVPVSSERLKERGYNQSALIAGALAGFWGISMADKCLAKPYDNKKQMELKENQRRANVIGAYSCINREIIKDKRLLLIDDVITTGSTVEECAKMLYCSGANYCDVFAFAHTEKLD